MNRKILLLLVSILLVHVVFAQQVKVQGVVSDENGTTLPMTSIVIKGTTQGTLTDMDGNYAIDADLSQTLGFHFIGYTNLFVPLTDSRVKKNGDVYTLNVTLLSESTTTEDVVIIGYGSQKRESMTSAVSDVSGAELRKMAIPNLSQAVSETMPGVFGSVQSGQPGKDNAKLNIRGVSTFSSATEPLVLIDGMQAAGGFEQVDAGEVESITILKDAAATAPYGVLGANGVILITTRRGTKGAPSVSASVDMTIKALDEYPASLGAYDVIQLGNEANMNAGSYAYLRSNRELNMYRDPNRDEILYPDVDWYRELIKPVGFEEHARVNVSGGTDFVQYFSSLSYNHQGDIMNIENKDGFYDPSFDFKKINFRTNLDFDITKTTKLSTNIAGRTENLNEPNVALKSDEFYNIFKFIGYSSPITFPMYYPADFVEAHPDPLEPDFEGVRVPDMLYYTPGQSNAYRVLNYSGFRKERRDIVDFALNLKQDLNFITEGLEFSAKFSYSTKYIYRKTYGYGINMYLFDRDSETWERSDRTNYNTTRTGFHPGSGEDYKEVYRNMYYEAKLSYNKSFDDHNFNIMGVFNRSKFEKKFEFPYFHEDWAGRVTYDYDAKYMAEFTVGYNGSEKYAKGKRFGFFPSGSVAWNLAKEEFVLDNLAWLDQFKIRYSFGKVGSEKAGARWLYQGGWGSYDKKLTSQPEFGMPIGGYEAQIGELKLPNEDATWEISTEHNLGFDIGLLKDKLNVKLDLFNRYRENILVKPATVTYFNSGIGAYHPWDVDENARAAVAQINLGEVKSKGLELIIDYSHYFANGILLGVNANLNLADNRVVIKNDREFAPEYQKSAGKPVGWNSGLQTNGYLNSFEEAVNAPPVAQNNQTGNYRWADYNADGIINNLDNVPMVGTSQPLATYGFGGSVGYKGFDLRVRFFGKGNVYYNATGIYWYPTAEATKLAGKTFHLDRWSPTNTTAAYPAFSSNSGAMYQSRHDQKYVNARYLRLQSVSLSYLIVSPWIKQKLNISTMKVFVNGNNLVTWTGVPYGDPEGGNSFAQGLGNYPLVKRITLGLDINF